MKKKYFRIFHQWLGLISGLLVFIICITGCIYTFKEEILNFSNNYEYVKVGQKFLKPTTLLDKARSTLPNKTVHSIEYRSPQKAAVVSFYQYKPYYSYKMYINPYSGKILHVDNQEGFFFPWILKGHMYLWLPRDIGRTVVMMVTLIFLLMLVSGFVLWFPKNWKGLKQRIWFRWKNTTKWKRKNWDLHAINGFFSLLFAIIFCVTGLVWVLPGFADIYHKVLGGKKSMQYAEALSTITPSSEKNSGAAMNTLFLRLEKKPYSSLEIHPPETDSSSILIVGNPDDGTYWRNDYLFFDQYSLKPLKVNHIWGRFSDASFSDKILRINYDVHVGAALGIFGKILVFTFSLILALLPITGFFIWFGKKQK